MQFYIVDPDPEKSVKMLPNYALKKVNVREGYQILSDIGHIFDVHWETQNNVYSESHALTRYFCSTPARFKEFIDNYDQCCGEYYHRFKKITKHMKFFGDWITRDYYQKIVDKLPEDMYSSVIKYMTTQKRDKLTDEEINRLVERN